APPSSTRPVIRPAGSTPPPSMPLEDPFSNPLPQSKATTPPSVTRTAPAPLPVQTSTGGLPSRYQQITLIGSGGMGMVYKAFDANLQRWVAIKTFREEAASRHPEVLKRFLNESRIMASLDHPTIPKVFDLSVASPYYLSFEFLEGDDLRKVIGSFSTEAPPDLQGCLTLGIQLASGFHHAAEKGILHRDIKPENLILETGGRVRIIDFGLAHLEGSMNMTESGVVIGTPWYLAPERLQGQPASVATELYAFGFALYELLTTVRPYPGDAVTVVFARDPIPLRQMRPDAPPELESVLARCLSKNPLTRPTNFAEIESLLTGILHQYYG
ncbi:MAG TPA: protein kinase, partial [Candidatus Ozemobacteraceae bacterium]|nr:protein kinase [Candidatus Ozemobacteraceae bacterium]